MSVQNRTSRRQMLRVPTHHFAGRTAPFVGALLAALAIVFVSGCSLLDKETTTTGASATTTLASATTTSAYTGGTVEVGFLGVTHIPGQNPYGGVYPCVIEVEPQDTGSVAVGVIEGEVFGTGAMWRAASWAAPIAATSILNLDLADYKFTYQVDGGADGPSAGALMTCGTLAALLGDEIAPDATMTGAVNPDYTVGPVGGIPYKLEGAAAAGKTRVLIPLGQRMEYEEVSGEWVDLEAYGRELGLEVREVGTIYEAYELLTGTPLPQPEAPEGRPALDAAASDVLKSQTGSWISYCQEQLDAYEEMGGAVTDMGDASYEEGRIAFANESLADSGNYLQQGLNGQAYFSAVSAARNALLAVNYVITDLRIVGNGTDAALTWLREGSITPATDDMMNQLLQVSPVTVGEALSVMEAWGYWAVASGLSLDADAALDDAAESGDDDTKLDALYLAVFNYTLAGVMVDAASDSFALGQELSTAPIASETTVSELADAYRRAAAANWESINALVLPRFSEQWGVSSQEAGYLLGRQDISYAETSAVMGNLGYLVTYIPEGPGRDYATLGVALTAFADSATILAKYYSYGAEVDDSGYVTGFANEKALSHGLDFARERAEEMIGVASANGTSSVALPLIYHESAGVEREAGADQKLDALYDYWMATLYARVMALLEGELTALTP